MIYIDTTTDRKGFDRRDSFDDDNIFKFISANVYEEDDLGDEDCNKPVKFVDSFRAIFSKEVADKLRDSSMPNGFRDITMVRKNYYWPCYWLMTDHYEVTENSDGSIEYHAWTEHTKQ